MNDKSERILHFKMQPELAAKVLGLRAASPLGWEALTIFLTARLEACRDRLETGQDHRFDQGYAASIRETLKVMETAEAVSKQANRAR